MELNIGLVSVLVASAASSDDLDDVLVGCKVLHKGFGLGTVRSIDAVTNRCQIQLDRQNVLVECSLREFAGKGRNSTIYVKPAPVAA
ncbi:MAG: hypothetical protein H6R16_1706 [Proteobacteria bacterium]|nr:hypothetical protein [Pseudomonadota bacterium]